MRAVLISINPKWCEKIANGEKTIEVRKTVPSLERPFKCYIYCTQGKLKDLGSCSEKIYQNRMRVIGEFVCDRVDGYKYRLTTYEETPYKGKYISKEELAKTCLSIGEVNDYLNGKNGYLWHISQLKIYDKSKALSEFESACHCFNIKNVECKTNAFGEYVFQHYDNSFCRICKYYNSDFGDCDKPAFQPLKRPPQSWCYVEVSE